MSDAPDFPVELPANMGPPSLVAQLAAVTERLNDLMETETALLATPELPDLGVISPEKSRLAIRYDQMMRELVTRPLMELQGDPESPRLAESVRRMDRIARANARAIEIHMAANQRILENIASAARHAVTPNFSYGGRRMGYGVNSRQMAAVAVNRVL